MAHLIKAWACLVLVAATTSQLAATSSDPPAWSYKCVDSKCVKVEASGESENSVCLSACRMFCGTQVGTLWPYPTGKVAVANSLVRLNPEQITFDTSKVKGGYQFTGEHANFQQLIESKKPRWSQSKKYDGLPLRVSFEVADGHRSFDAQMDNSYKLSIRKVEGELQSVVTADNAFGARYALTTLSQLVIYDDLRGELVIPGEVHIDDSPAFNHRGIILDTSRSYFSVASIKRAIHAMSLSKLNVFHWHVTDSHSFPLEVASQPQLSRYGSYSPEKVYSEQDVKDIVEYGKVRGVAVIPEFDAPAHVGEGWQKTDLTACFNAQPWKNFCVEPPCGQLDPTQGHLYDVLEDIYRSMWNNFGEPHLFHMGGDEVSVSCWNSSARIQNWMKEQGWQLEEKDFMRLWGHFQDNAMKRLDRVMGEKKRDIILWTSRLTDVPYVTEYIDKARTIIQIWTTGQDKKVTDLLERGFRVIVSNYDALYLDCGFAGWVTDGNNWCSPYIGWQKVYNNRMEEVAGKPEYVKLIMGAEAALWSEQADEHTLDSRLWPRASALAERLWTNPVNGWRAAETRMLHHREDLVANGIGAELLEPEWCLRNEGNCPI